MCSYMVFYAIVSSAGFARSRSSRNYYRPTYQEAVDAAIAQEIGQKDIRHHGGNPHSVSSSSGVNQVKHDNVWSHGRSVDRRHQRKRCFRCGLVNHTPDKCKYKDSECFNCHLTGHNLSVAMQNHHQRRANNMYTELDSEAGL